MAKVKKETKKKVMGRPKIGVDLEMVERLAAQYNTAEDISNVLQCSIDTIERRIKETYGKEFTFAELIKKGLSLGKASLRKNQYNLSKTSAAMAIWLGKQYLGQKDKEVDSFVPEINLHYEVV